MSTIRAVRTIRLLWPLLFVATAGCPSTPPQLVDPDLATYIDAIKAVDNHAHPMLPVAQGQPADTDFDALPLDGIPPFPLPWRITLDNPEWGNVARSLYGLEPRDSGQALIDGRARRVAAEGAHFGTWVLDQTGIAVMFANRITMGPGLEAPRFRWVPFDDALMLPLDIRGEAARTPDTRSLYPKEAAILGRYLKDLGLKQLPPTLDDYVARVVRPTLDHQRQAGAVAIKFEAAYLRPLDFDDPNPPAARAVYARYARGGTPTHAEYKTLEDDLFRVIAREAGQRGLAVHIHVLETFGGYYSARGSQPEQLEPVFNDSTLRGTNFVMLHGGWPDVGQTEAMMSKPNVYADFSMMDQILEPTELAHVLRQWLARWPDKVLFGSDAFDGGPPQGWDEVAALATGSARRALGIALTGMVRDGEISHQRAETLARMVLRENANKLYKLELK